MRQLLLALLIVSFNVPAPVRPYAVDVPEPSLMPVWVEEVAAIPDWLNPWMLPQEQVQ